MCDLFWEKVAEVRKNNFYFIFFYFLDRGHHTKYFKTTRNFLVEEEGRYKGSKFEGKNLHFKEVAFRVLVSLI